MHTFLDDQFLSAFLADFTIWIPFKKITIPCVFCIKWASQNHWTHVLFLYHCAERLISFCEFPIRSAYWLPKKKKTIILKNYCLRIATNIYKKNSLHLLHQSKLYGYHNCSQIVIDVVHERNKNFWIQNSLN